MIYRAFQALARAYSGRYALATNTVTAGVLGCTGKTLTPKEWDFKRTRNMTVVCMCAGPLMHFWYRFLDRRFPGTSMKAVRTKVAIDLLSGPFWYGWYLGGLSVLRGVPVSELGQEVKNKLPIIVAVDLTLWPIFQTLNFKFFPPQYRILVLKVNELFLDVVFSHIIHNEYSLSSLLNSFSRTITGKERD